VLVPYLWYPSKKSLINSIDHPFRKEIDMFSPSLKTYSTLSVEEKKQLLSRETIQNTEISQAVRNMLERFQKCSPSSRDALIQEYTQRFDHIIQDNSLIEKLSIDEAQKLLGDELTCHIEKASQAIRLFHKAQKRNHYSVSLHQGEVRCERLIRPIERVGFYVPGGLAPLFSSLLMMAIPAQLAGCHHLLLCTPPLASGTISPLTHGVASLMGIHEIHAIGGAQAIAAMAYGSKEVTAVDKIFGPGNAWVNEAKLQISAGPSHTSIDLPAGPSEVMVVADHTAQPAFIAADLLAQAEHGPDAQVICVLLNSPSTSQLFSDVTYHINQQLNHLSRHDIITSSLKNSGFILAQSRKEACTIINSYAPEHLILQIDQPRELLPAINHAGSVFLGHQTPESLGDYASGTNHILPTAGYGRQYSGLSLEAFEKTITIQEASLQPHSPLAQTVIGLAKAEGLDAHANAMSLRVNTSS